ncbi:MAG TPA: hypothetical protein VFI33_19125 [Puia sp.]|nr:hypothetical protein [Puia sp.]
MEKFLLILRQVATRRTTGTPEEWPGDIPVMLEWIHFLSESGNYCGGAPLAIFGRQVTKEKVIEDYSWGEAYGGILGYDVILAENMNQAVSIAQTCPLVMNGIAVREVRPILALTR